MKSKLKGNVGLIGLGRIGEGLAQRLRQGAYGIIAHDPQKDKNGVPPGIHLVESLSQLVNRIRTPRLILVSVPHDSVDLVLDSLLCLLTVGDTVADMGNSHYRDSIDRHKRVNAQGIN
ncbi:MAG: NAD(P)-binding domain-containing protein, partial [Nitrososphaera sp.]|nr:NAD(P)-binding domain-containing protein [Nitrososphaera sp.]